MIIDLTDWPGQVVEITASNVMIEHKPEVGKSITNEVTTLTIAEITDSSIVLDMIKLGDIIPQKSET